MRPWPSGSSLARLGAELGGGAEQWGSFPVGPLPLVEEEEHGELRDTGDAGLAGRSMSSGLLDSMPGAVCEAEGALLLGDGGVWAVLVGLVGEECGDGGGGTGMKSQGP